MEGMRPARVHRAKHFETIDVEQLPAAIAWTQFQAIWFFQVHHRRKESNAPAAATCSGTKSSLSPEAVAADDPISSAICLPEATQFAPPASFRGWTIGPFTYCAYPPNEARNSLRDLLPRCSVPDIAFQAHRQIGSRPGVGSLPAREDDRLSLPLQVDYGRQFQPLDAAGRLCRAKLLSNPCAYAHKSDYDDGTAYSKSLRLVMLAHWEAARKALLLSLLCSGVSWGKGKIVTMVVKQRPYHGQANNKGRELGCLLGDSIRCRVCIWPPHQLSKRGSVFLYSGYSGYSG
eukprot:2267736-Rhodomonas_salina.1